MDKCIEKRLILEQKYRGESHIHFHKQTHMITFEQREMCRRLQIKLFRLVTANGAIRDRDDY